MERQPAGLGIASRRRQIRCNARGNNLVCRTLQGKFHPRLFLVDELTDALCPGEIALGDHLGKEIKETRQILLQYLCTQLKTRQERVRLTRACIGDDVRPDAARIEAAQLRKLCIAVLRRIDRSEDLCKEIGIGQVLLRNCSHREVKVQIDNRAALSPRDHGSRAAAAPHPFGYPHA